MRPYQLPLLLLSCGLAVLASCSGGSKGNPNNRGTFQLATISTGQGQVYPYRIRQLFLGEPTATILNIESIDTLKANVAANNPVLPVATLPTETSLPDGSPGNNFLHFRFTHYLQVESILSDKQSAQQTNSGLTSAVSVLAYDPATEASTMALGRGFVGGRTYVNRNGVLTEEQVAWVNEDTGLVEVADGFEGFPHNFSGDTELVEPNAFVFVADSDSNLSSFETFDPNESNLLLRLLVNNSVRNSDNAILEQEACTATTVGPDPNPANVLGYTVERLTQIEPGNNASGVSPLTDIQITFNKPVQPTDVGAFFTSSNLTPQAGGIALNVTINAATFSLLYYADPVGYSDFCRYRVRPAYSLPSQDTVTVAVNKDSIRSLKDLTPLGADISTQFTTEQGPGIINAPVSPDALYIGMGGATPGVAILDLNGYGQGTNGLEPDDDGNPTLDPQDTFFALNNPNIGQPGLVPSLAPGDSQLDAGSNGPLTLVQDTRGNTNLLPDPIVNQPADIQVGLPLDLAFNNENINVNAGPQNQVNPQGSPVQPGNCIAVSTHPNPPPLRFPPPNPSRAIFGEEPTGVVFSNGANGVNLLTSGNQPMFRERSFPGLFYGPAPAPPSPPPPASFLPYNSRQQIGHFLYVLDRGNRQILVLNSNRFTVLDTIPMSDPFNMTISPNLGLLAVSNFSSSSVSIIDIDPRSSRFHEVVAETKTDEGPTAISWQPDGEAIVVTCTLANSITILGGGDYKVTSIASGGIADPIAVAVTERYATTGNTSGLYYAYVLNANGTVAVYESGPTGTNGIGFDDMIGVVGPTFPRARSMKLDYYSGLGGVFVGHVDDMGVAVVSRLELTSSPQGPLSTGQQSNTGFLQSPTFRQKEWSVTEAFGGASLGQPLNGRLSGASVADFAFDELLNQGFSQNQQTNVNGTLGRSVLNHSSKGSVLGGLRPYDPHYLFVAMGDTGKVDVFDVVARVKVKTIDVPGVTFLSTYWKQ